jgi:hypothetical protein
MASNSGYVPPPFLAICACCELCMMLAPFEDLVVRKSGLVQDDVLLLSQRKIADLVAYCLAYEFEDTFASVTNARRIDATCLGNLNFCRRFYKILRTVSGSKTLAHKLTPSPRNKLRLDNDLELFFPIFNHSNELYSLSMIPNWRQRCQYAACFITEVRPALLPKYLLELLSTFDHIFIGVRHYVQDVARITGRPCTYLPLAVDVLSFAPASVALTRPIDVCNIGRRSQVTHRALLTEAEQTQAFYYYDTVAASGSDLKQRTFRVDDPREHRNLLATLLQRSKYFVANRSYVNSPELIAGHDEISARFYEGAAAGAVMIGEAPRTEEFKQQFDWPDAIIHLPFDSPNVGEIISDLNKDRERLRAARQNNVREAARRHDWLYRIQVVFDTFGLGYTEKMLLRAQRLEQIASQATAT